MKSFVEYITDELTTILSEAGGAEAGKLELLSTSLNVARSYAKKMFEKGGQDFEKQMPNFDKNYTLAQRSAVEDLPKEKICLLLTTEMLNYYRKDYKQVR